MRRRHVTRPRVEQVRRVRPQYTPLVVEPPPVFRWRPPRQRRKWPATRPSRLRRCCQGRRLFHGRRVVAPAPARYCQVAPRPPDRWRCCNLLCDGGTGIGQESATTAAPPHPETPRKPLRAAAASRRQRGGSKETRSLRRSWWRRRLRWWRGRPSSSGGGRGATTANHRYRRDEGGGWEREPPAVAAVRDNTTGVAAGARQSAGTGAVPGRRYRLRQRQETTGTATQEADARRRAGGAGR